MHNTRMCVCVCVCVIKSTHTHTRLENRGHKIQESPKKRYSYNNGVIFACSSGYASNFRHSSRAWSRFASDNDRSITIADYLTGHRAGSQSRINHYQIQLFHFLQHGVHPEVCSLRRSRSLDRSRLLTWTRNVSLLRGCRRVVTQFRMSTGIVGHHIVYIQNGTEQSDPERSISRQCSISRSAAKDEGFSLSLSLSLGPARTLSRKSLRSGRVAELASFWNSSRERIRYLRFSFNTLATDRLASMLLESKLLEASLVILLSRFFSDRSGFVLGSGTSGSDYNSLRGNRFRSVPQCEERYLSLVSTCRGLFGRCSSRLLFQFTFVARFTFCLTSSYVRRATTVWPQ